MENEKPVTHKNPMQPASHRDVAMYLRSALVTSPYMCSRQAQYCWYLNAIYGVLIPDVPPEWPGHLA